MKLILIILITLIVILVLGYFALRNDGTYTDVTVNEFKPKMNSQNIVIVDVRTPGEIAQGKIKGAKEIDFKSSSFKEKIAALDKSKTYLIYCASGRRSGLACKSMHKQNFQNLFNLSGGYNAWKSAK